MPWLSDIYKSDESIRLIFEQARNMVVTGVFYTASTWFWERQSVGFVHYYEMFLAIILAIAAAFLLVIQQSHIAHKVDQAKLPLWLNVVLRSILPLTLVGLIAATVRYQPPITLLL